MPVRLLPEGGLRFNGWSWRLVTLILNEEPSTPAWPVYHPDRLWLYYILGAQFSVDRLVGRGEFVVRWRWAI
jgi:hypothetical protein